MPLHLLKEENGTLEAHLPGHLQKICLIDLQPEIDQANTYFMGLVLINYPLTKLGNGLELFKAVLEESVEGKSSSSITAINAFFFGKLAEECAKVVHQGDILVLTGFILTKSPTSRKDGRHHYQLELSEDSGTTVYLFGRSGAIGTSKAGPSSVSQKYTYTPLNQLKGGTIVNVYGVVKFFKPPYRSKGTDYCSVVTIVDQSNAKLTCMLFSGNLDTLPKIYKIGDIIRFHRIKIQEFNNEMQGITSAGFSALVFDGTVGTPIIPRTSSKLFHYTSEDQKMLEILRSWAVNHLSIGGLTVKLSAVQPMQYFDLTCQLVGKAEVTVQSFLLKVWDGTECPYPSWKVFVEDDALEGDKAVIHQLRNLTADILVYDNHLQVAKSLMVGSFLRIHSLHAKLQTPSHGTETEALYIEFQLHGGTGYGRGITTLPESNYDVKDLQKYMDSIDLKESQCSEDTFLLELEGQELLPCDALERCQQSSVTILTAHQHLKKTSLKTILSNKAPQKYCVRVKLKTYEPKKLYQSVKLYCPKCDSLQEVPGENDLASILQDCATKHPNAKLQNTSWYKSTVWNVEHPKERQLVIHFVKRNEMLQNPEDSLIMIEDAVLHEVYRLSQRFGSVIPVISKGGHLSLADISAPYLIQGKRWYYGCKHCSNLKYMECLQSITKENFWKPTSIAKALGIEPLHHVLIMKFTLDDGTGCLDAYLWNNSEIFFRISASEILIDETLQEKLEMIMSMLCPAKQNLDDHPWLECCIKSYNTKGGMESRVCYQIFDTVVVENI
ncbi:protection of telomeres protein 1 isoform X2 [Rhinatrema bivittatum]|nr:protection of telomeres protein 1 isoform X2 [Rhinatrema bivittatum]